MSNSFFLPDSEERGEQQPVTNTHVMVDLETLAVGVDAPILTIGAVLFDPFEQDSADALWARAIHLRIAVPSAVKHGGPVDGGTLNWWFSQDPAAIQQLVGEDVLSLHDALISFRQYCAERAPYTDTKFWPGHSAYPAACAMWAKGPDFDCKILEYAHEQVGEIPPFKFHQYRCVRTIQDLGWPEGPDTRPNFDCGVKHDARADAVNQAMMVQAGYKKLGLSHSSVTMDTF